VTAYMMRENLAQLRLPLLFRTHFPDVVSKLLIAIVLFFKFKTTDFPVREIQGMSGK